MLFANEMLNQETNSKSIAESFKDPNVISSIIIVDEVSQLPTETIAEFCAEGGVGEQLVTEGKLRKNTFIKLNKIDDLTRRTKMMALQLAKENNDVLWTLLAKNRVKERELIGKIMKKYGNQAKKLAKEGQQEWLRGPKPVLPKNFQKNRGE